ncbi:MAG: ABC transporter substrate-binding protein [Marivibrio sp.]|uniref:ABC transporter substrate-binding protein n=1 Tax=Marivibrio sp. TaxID=2039719 RepID=UPI0032F091CC
MGWASRIRQAAGAPRLAFALVATAVIGASAVPAAADGAPGPTPAADFAPAGAAEIRIALPFPPGVEYAGFYRAQDLGLYAAEGLRVRLLHELDDPLARLQQGGADVAVAWTADHLTARAAGAQTVEIARLIAGASLTLVCRDADALADAGPRGLAGLRLGRPDGPTGRGLDLWLATMGLDAASGGGAARTTAQPTRVSAADPALFDCLTVRRHVDLADAPAGFAPTFALGRLGAPLAEDALYASRHAVADPQRRDHLARLLRALSAGWADAFADPAAAAAAVGARTGTAPSPAAVAERLAERRTLAPSAGPVGAPDPALIQAAAVWLLNAGARPPLTRFPQGGWTHGVADAVAGPPETPPSDER